MRKNLKKSTVLMMVMMSVIAMAACGCGSTTKFSFSETSRRMGDIGYRPTGMVRMWDGQTRYTWADQYRDEVILTISRLGDGKEVLSGCEVTNPDVFDEVCGTRQRVSFVNEKNNQINN